MALFGKRKLPPVPLFVALGVVVIVGFAYATYQVWSNDRALRERGRQTTATVVEISRRKVSRVHVEFQAADGRRVQALVGQGDEAPGPRVRVGDEIPIVYDPLSPTSDVRDTRAPDNSHLAYLLLGTTVAGAVAIPLATRGLIRAHRRQRTLR